MMRLTILIIALLMLLPVPVLANDFFKGREIYQIKCAQCHGPRGEGMLNNMPNFSRGESIMKPQMELFRVIKNGKGIMPGFVGQLKDQQIHDVIVYIRSLY